MKIVILSDLNWEQHLRHVTMREVAATSTDFVLKSRYASIQRYLSIILGEQAEVVCFAGDVTGDGSCGHGYQNAFKMLLSVLDQLKVHSCFIPGNHDEVEYYQEVIDFSEKLYFASELSNKSAMIKGVSILGVPYETTYSKTKIKKLLERESEKVDVLMAHAQLKRRIRLFDFDASLIITGHYDRKLFGHKGSTFVSLDNDMSEISYAVHTVRQNNTETKICIKKRNGSIYSFTEMADKIMTQERNHMLLFDNEPTVDLKRIESHIDRDITDEQGEDINYLKYLRGIQYLKLLDRLAVVDSDKTLRPTLEVTQNVIGLPITPTYKVSESLIVDYLGKRTR